MLEATYLRTAIFFFSFFFLLNSLIIRLPHMAKSLEEHLYRSAFTKEEYMDQNTLRDRLQIIAQNLESHQSNNSNLVGKLQPNDSQQLQELLRAQGGNNTGGGMNPIDSGNIMGGVMGGNANNNNNNMSDSMRRRSNAQQQIDALAHRNLQLNPSNGDIVGGSGGGGDPQKVIRQQQQRLLLLRHASKCKLGPECTTRFCAQMKPLWQHMKGCRDKDCQTRHCQSSRCVLTHYRICKSQGKTANCEICGPVMEHIRRQEAAEGLDSSDPLADKDGDTNPLQPHQDIRSMSVFGGQDEAQKNAAAAKRQLQEQNLRQQQQQHQLQNQMGNNTQQMLLQLQTMQMRIQQQQNVINKLKNQQNQLSEQQKQLQGQQGQNAQNQFRLLQQLEMRAKQQQQIEYRELMMQNKNIQQMQLKIKAAHQQHNHNQLVQQFGAVGGVGGQPNQIPPQVAANQNNLGMINLNNVSNNTLGNSTGNQNNPQQLGNSQRSHHSTNSNNSQQRNRQPIRQQQPTLSQNLQKAMNDPIPSASPSSNKNDDPLAGTLLDDASSNPLSQLGALDASIDVEDSEDGLELPEELGPLDQPLEDSPKKESSEGRDDGPKVPMPPSLTEASSGGSDLPSSKISNPGLDDNSERSQGSKSKKRRTLGGTLDKAPRGRGGGKGKRLREIEKINLSTEAEGGSSGSVSGIKRSADEMSKNNTDASPDTEVSSGAAGGNKKGGQPSLPKGDVEQHLLMLNKGLHLTSRTITHKCLPIVQQLIDDPYGWVFRDAVDPVLFGLPDYFEVVKNPMHLLLVKKKLENAVYTDMASFERDVKLVFENAILYNGEDSDVGTLAKTMKGVFETEYKKVCEGM